MKFSRMSRLAAVAGTLLMTGGCLDATKDSPNGDTAQAAVDRGTLAEAVVAQWSDLSALAARGLIAEYGEPDEVHFGRLVWNGGGPWRRTVVRDIRPSFAEGEDLGIIEQTIGYPLTPAQQTALSVFGDRLIFNPRVGELTSRADREELNFLRLNLADDVVHGRLSGPQARDSYAGISSLEESGKSSPYMAGLRFSPGP